MLCADRERDVMERLCVVIYETSETGKKTLHDVLAAYAIEKNVEVTIKWLKPSAKETEIASACVEAQMAFVSAGETERATLIGRVLYRVNPTCALIYFGENIPEGKQVLVSYFSNLFPARPVLYLDRPGQQEYFNAVRDLSERESETGLFVWETKGMKYRIPYGSILYFRSERNYVYMSLKNGAEYSFLGKLTNIEQQLPPNVFVRVHQSYLIKRSEILLIDKQKKAVQLSNGEEIFISKAHYKETLEA